MSSRDFALMAHLMRRAGFGATRDELEAQVARGYEATVEELLHPGESGTIPDDILFRYHADQSALLAPGASAANWMYRMINSRCPLEEKLALFWHGLFATDHRKLNQGRVLLNQVEMFRQRGMGNFRDLLTGLSMDPAMIVYLDNETSHRHAVNENYGRELLELFSMGIGNYTERDIKACARAFTGWTIENAEYMRMGYTRPYGTIAWHFKYLPEDHDDEEKTFLGQTGRFNGEDVIDIIAATPAAARFVCRRLFEFFVADEVDDDGETLVQAMMDVYFESGYEIRSVLRTMLNSDYFKSEGARFGRVKGPIELVVGAIRLAGSYRQPTYGVDGIASQALFMGQGLLMPPTVEGWHEGPEWIDSGALVERVNFVASELGDVTKPGIRAIIERLSANNGDALSPDELVDRCLDLVGPIAVSEETHSALTDYAAAGGDVVLAGRTPGDASEQRVGDLLSLIASTPEFQLA